MLARSTTRTNYNYNNNWVDVGVRLSWNVLKLAPVARAQPCPPGAERNRRPASDGAVDGCTDAGAWECSAMNWRCQS